MIHCRTIDSPIGSLLLAAGDDGLRLIEFASPRHPRPRRPDWVDGDHALLRNAERQLREYFDGTRQRFDLPLSPQGTEFQRAVWLALASIGYGQTWSYRQLATHLGRPSATRAVGAANGRNPLPIVLPCHRVIGADGGLTGFGGGLPTKKFLLQFENAWPRDAEPVA